MLRALIVVFAVAVWPSTAGALSTERFTNQEPYGGTEDINLTTEERVDYEPPDAPPPQAAARFLAGDNIPKGVEG